MSHFAKVDSDNIVTDVIVAELDFITSGAVGDADSWLQTSYNKSIRKNFAGVGYKYDSDRDAFISPQPYPSWLLIEETCEWQSPVAYPEGDSLYLWDEPTTDWVYVA